MSAWSVQRQLFFFTFFILCIAFVISALLFSFFHTTPTCDDGIQNGVEEGIDCGVSCPRACAVAPEPIVVAWTRLFPLNTGLYTTASYLENTNIQLYAPSVRYEVQLYDDENSLIDRSTGTTPIMPNGPTPVVVPHVFTGEAEADRAVFRFLETPRFVQTPAPTAFVFSDVVASVQAVADPRVDVYVTNTGERGIQEVAFVVLVTDWQGNTVAASTTYEKFFAAGERRLLSYTWPAPFQPVSVACPENPCAHDVRVFPIVHQW